LKIRRKSRGEPHKVYGDWILYQDIGPDLNFQIDLYIKQGGEYRKTVYAVKGNTCDIVASDKVFYPSFANAMEPSFPLKCNIPAGKYYVNGYWPDMSDIPPVLRSGDYLADIQLLRDGKLLQGSKVQFHIINLKGGLVGLA
jgi:hypothetical protein